MILHYRIIKNYEKGYSVWELSQKYKIEETELKEKLEEYYRSKNNLKKYHLLKYELENNNAKTNLKDILIDFKKGYGTRKLARKYNTTRYQIQETLKNHYILINKINEYNNIVSKNHNAIGNLKYTLTKAMIEEYKKGKSAKKISEENNIPYTCLRRLLIKENLLTTRRINEKSNMS